MWRVFDRIMYPHLTPTLAGLLWSWQSTSCLHVTNTWDRTYLHIRNSFVYIRVIVFHVLLLLSFLYATRTKLIDCARYLVSVSFEWNTIVKTNCLRHKGQYIRTSHSHVCTMCVLMCLLFSVLLINLSFTWFKKAL